MTAIRHASTARERLRTPTGQPVGRSCMPVSQPDDAAPPQNSLHHPRQELSL